MASSLYAQLPQTAETQLAAKMSDLQSAVKETQHAGALCAPGTLRGSVTVLCLCSE